MRHRLYRYFDQRQWGDNFLAGKLLFRPLSYYRAYEDHQVRGDKNEGVAVFQPAGGLVVTNLTQSTTFTLPNHRFESAADQNEIWIYCMSRVRTAELAAEFGAVTCIEILDIPAFCRRVKEALPTDAEFFAKRVEYYRVTDAASPRWALPELIAFSKQNTFFRQAEFRLAFSTTGAMRFENVALQLVQGDGTAPPSPAGPDRQLISVGSLRDICLVHEISR
jgi:hypothetical protein